MSIEQGSPRRLLPPKQVEAIMDWSHSTLWRRVRAGDFPAPVKTGPNRTAFYEDVVIEAQANLPRVNYAPRPPADAETEPAAA